MPWTPPSLTVRWPDYFRPEPDDDAQLVTMTIAAHEAGLVTKRAAVQRLQRAFGIENVDQFLETLEEEADEKQQKALAIASAAPPVMPPKQGAPPAKPPPKPPLKKAPAP